MRHPYLLSPPPARWHLRGAANFRSAAREATSPRRALEEWLALAEAIDELGGAVVVLPAPDVDPPLTGLPYAANHGAFFPRRGAFRLAHMAAPHRGGESPVVAHFVERELGLPVEATAAAWEGQADITTLGPEKLVLSWGVRTEAAACDELIAHLPEATDVLSVELRAPFFHGDTCVSAIPLTAGRGLLLVHEGALVDATLGTLEMFAGSDYALVPVSEADALAYACNGLAVDRTVLMPEGVSDALCARLEVDGLRVRTLSFRELFGKGGGGPRCLVNELRGLAPEAIPSSVAFAGQRAALHALVERYAEA